jgi:hypothetical protein
MPRAVTKHTQKRAPRRRRATKKAESVQELVAAFVSAQDFSIGDFIEFAPELWERLFTTLLKRERRHYLTPETVVEVEDQIRAQLSRDADRSWLKLDNYRAFQLMTAQEAAFLVGLEVARRGGMR